MRSVERLINPSFRRMPDSTAGPILTGVRKRAGLIYMECFGIHVSYLGPWHANLIHIDRRKCVLFDCVVRDVSRAQIRELDRLFMGYPSCVLADAGIPEAGRARILSECGEVGFANTSSKSVAGEISGLQALYQTTES
jgi:hypothetical protein